MFFFILCILSTLVLSTYSLCGLDDFDSYVLRAYRFLPHGPVPSPMPCQTLFFQQIELAVLYVMSIRRVPSPLPCQTLFFQRIELAVLYVMSIRAFRSLHDVRVPSMPTPLLFTVDTG